MNDGLVHACSKGVALPPLLALSFAPLLVKTLTIRCKVRPEAYAWLEQAGREVNQVWNFANATSHESLNSYTRKRLPPVEKKKRNLGRVHKVNPSIRQSRRKRHMPRKNGCPPLT
jgi:hypothetical protein